MGEFRLKRLRCPTCDKEPGLNGVELDRVERSDGRRDRQFSVAVVVAKVEQQHLAA